MSDTRVILGGFEFRDFEIPESIATAVTQRLKVHRLQGSRRVVDAMGVDDAPLSWSGRFRGPDAGTRVAQIDRMARAGKPVSLTWGDQAFTVVIGHFEPVYAAAYERPYSITCEVVTNDAHAAAPLPTLGLTQMMGGDLKSLSGAVAALKSPGGLSGALASVQGAIGKVRDFTTAVRSEIATTLAPIRALQSQVIGLIGSAEDILGDATAVGGVIPGLSGRDLVSGLLRQANAATDAASLYTGGDYAARMAKNLDAVGSAGAHVVVAGADLNRLALTAYGDATEWTTIAEANGLTDPIVTGIQEITVPPTALGTDGVPG